MAGTHDSIDRADYVTAQEASEQTGIPVRRIYRYVKEQRLHPLRPAARELLISLREIKQLQSTIKVSGRPQKRAPKWIAFRGGSRLLETDIQVQIRPGQEERLREKLRLIEQENRHAFKGSIARYILRDPAAPATLSIHLIWKDSDLPDAETHKRELAAFRAELADVVDWETARTHTLEGLIYT
ncbi:MAG: hypothetical protein IMW89_06125 [Ktedonobacteraceae bacterium]|nr:hypothetical protein [Ktedonobacteraceae bacterium]